MCLHVDELRIPKECVSSYGRHCVTHVCSDILTPLPALGMPFEIDDVKGPIIDRPITSMEAVQQLYPLDLDQLSFVGDALKTLRQEVGDQVRSAVP